MLVVIRDDVAAEHVDCRECGLLVLFNVGAELCDVSFDAVGV